MEIFTIVSDLIADAVLIAKTLICFTLLRNCEITENFRVIRPDKNTCSCHLKDSKYGSEKKSISSDTKILRESIDNEIVSKTRLVPVKPPRAFRQSRVNQDSMEKSKNNTHSEMLCSDNIRKPNCYCGQHEYSKGCNSFIQRKFKDVTIPIEKNSSGSLPISNKPQKQISFKIDNNTSESTSKIAELTKLSIREICATSSQLRNSPYNCSISKTAGSNETSQYNKLPTMNLQQKMEGDANPMIFTETKSKCGVKNSPFQKLYKYVARVFHRCIKQISKK